MGLFYNFVGSSVKAKIKTRDVGMTSVVVLLPAKYAFSLDKSDQANVFKLV
jgi:hypothetical protein